MENVITELVSGRHASAYNSHNKLNKIKLLIQ